MKKILTTITFFVFALAIAQEIKNDLPYISFQDLSDFSESSKEVSRTMIYRSEKLAKIFGLNNKYFIDGGGQVLYGNVLVSEWVVLNSFTDYTYTNSKQRERLVLITKKENGKEVIKSVLSALSFPENVRGETLSLDEFAEISDNLDPEWREQQKSVFCRFCE